MIELRDAGVKYGNVTVVAGASFRVSRGAFAGLVGANGAGKTSILKLVAGIIVPAAGTVFVNGRDVTSYGRRDLARLVAGVWQRAPLSFGFTVAQLVRLGRTPHIAPMRWETDTDREIAAAAMAETHVSHLADRPASHLSAGELQRVFIATALAQQSPILLLDEPTSFLDLRQASRLSALLDRLQARGVTILCASHDLALLRRHASTVVLLSDQTAHRVGSSDDVLASAVLRDAFGVTEEEWYA